MKINCLGRQFQLVSHEVQYLFLLFLRKKKGNEKNEAIFPGGKYYKHSIIIQGAYNLLNDEAGNMKSVTTRVLAIIILLRSHGSLPNDW